MKSLLFFLMMLNITLTGEIDFVLTKIEDEEDPYTVIIPTLDGKPMSAAITVDDDTTTDDFLPVIFKDTVGRQSQLMFVKPIDAKSFNEYKDEVDHKEDDPEHQIGNIDEESVMLSIEQARHNLRKNKTPDSKAQEIYLKQIKREYKKRGITLHKVPLSRYSRIISMIPDVSGTELAKFKVPLPEGKIIDAYQAEDETEEQNEAVYVLLESIEDSDLKTDKEAKAESGENDIDILISGFDTNGMELVDEVAIHVVMNDKDYTELIIEETPELKEYLASKEINKKIRVAFMDEANKMCSQPVAALVLHQLDKSNNFDSVDESAIVLSRENAIEFKLGEDEQEANPEAAPLSKYNKVERMDVVFNEELSSKVADDPDILELGNDNSVLMVSVSAPAPVTENEQIEVVDRLKKGILIM